MGSDSPILVVGGRTTGLMMAGELARHGCPVRLIDQSPGIDPHSRATYIHSRTLEIFEGLGLADEIVAKGQPLKRVNIYANGKLMASSPELPVDSTFPFGAAFAQNKTEAILERHVRDLGVMVERNTSLLDLEQRDSEVIATLRSPDGSNETISTPWLIGCDGAHSVTRKLIKESFPGEIDPIPYLGADVIIDGPMDDDVVYLCMHDQGDVFLFLLDEGRRQIVATLPKHSERQHPPTLEEMQQIVDERGFTDLRLSDPRWLTTYRIHYRLVPRYRNGRVFLAGDAAHVHSVFEGQGMNTGMQDAHNLAWKLALVVKGIAPEWWLDTYPSERRRIAEDILEWTKAVTEHFTLFEELSQEERERVYANQVLPEHERIQIRTHEEQLDLDYRSSHLCEPELEIEPDSDECPRPGARAPDVSGLICVGKETSFLQLAGLPRHRLLLFRPEDAKARTQIDDVVIQMNTRHRHWVEVAIVASGEQDRQVPEGVSLIEDPQGRLRKKYGGDRYPIYLIRPDGYLSVRTDRPEKLEEFLARILHEDRPEFSPEDQ